MLLLQYLLNIPGLGNPTITSRGNERKKHVIKASKMHLKAAGEIKKCVGSVLCVGGNLFYGFGWLAG